MLCRAGTVRNPPCHHRSNRLRCTTPVLPATENAPPPPVDATAATQPARGQETVLVVEDNDQVRDIVRRILERHGHTVVTASCGADARVAAAEHRPDLLVTDEDARVLTDLAASLAHRRAHA